MGKHLPTVVWPAKRIGEYPQVYVLTEDTDTIRLEFWGPGTDLPTIVKLPRQLARMTARRINECLDRTRS